MTLILINSSKYSLKKFLGKIIALLGIILAGMVLARGTNGNFLSRIIDLPLWAELLLGGCAFVFIIIAVALEFNKETNKGDIVLDVSKLIISKVEYDLQKLIVIVYINDAPNKNIYKRTIKDCGGNNWIEFVSEGTNKKIEFLLESKKQENELKELIKSYQEDGIDITIKKSAFLIRDKWQDF